MADNIGLLFTKIYFKNSIFTYRENDNGNILLGDDASQHFKTTYDQIKNSVLQNRFTDKLGILYGDWQNIDQWINGIMQDEAKSLEDKKKALEELRDHLQSNVPVYLKTIYPGLLIGSGYMHDIKHNDALKLGFYFDYTTGLPVIPGSSVKGVLRSAFEKANGGYVKEILMENLKLSDEIIKKLMDEKVQPENVKGKIPLLEAHIFHGVYQVKEKYKDKDGNEKEKIVIKNLSPYQTDIFFDAFPIDTNNKNGKFLANDYITPHKEPLKDPVPLQFLKVLPQVTFQFNFRLNDFKDEEGKVLFPAEQKKELFKRILLDLGIGAKTNVGYGQFEEDHDNFVKKALETLDGEIKEIKRQIDVQNEGLKSVISLEMVPAFDDLKKRVDNYRNDKGITQENLLPAEDQAYLVKVLNKVIKKKKPKYREKLLNKIKAWGSNHIEQSLLEQIKM